MLPFLPAVVVILLHSADFSSTTADNHSHYRRFLHQPLFPSHSPPPTHHSPAPSLQSRSSNLSSARDTTSATNASAASTTTANDPFFPSYAAPPPPPTPSSSGSYSALPTFPANISSLVVPHNSRSSSSSHSSSASHKLVIISVVLCVLAASLLGSLAFLHRRHRHGHRGRFKLDEIPPPDDVGLYSHNAAASYDDHLPATKPKPFRTAASGTSREFLYLGTLASHSSEFEHANETRFESPEIRPLPPLPRQTLRLGRQNVDSAGGGGEGSIPDNDDSDEVELFYSPVGSSGRLRRLSSTSLRAIEVLERDIFLENKISYHPSSSSSSPGNSKQSGPSLVPNSSTRSSNVSSPDNFINSPTVSTPSPAGLKVPSPRQGECSIHSLDLRNCKALGGNEQFREETERFTGESDNAKLPSPPPPPPPPPPPLPPVPETCMGPPPLPRPWRSFSSGEQQKIRSGEISKPKLKGLHWDKFRASSDRAMVWDQLKPGSFPLNEELIETLFTVNGPSLAAKDPARRSTMPSLDPEYRVLDPKKSQNIAILLRAVNVTVEEVCDALIEGNAEMLGSQLLECLLKMAPTKEEELKLKDYKDESPLKLRPAEKFLKSIIDIPFAFKRVEAMLYMANFDSEAEYLRKSFDTLKAACEELKNSRMFLKLLEAVLNTGNRMNSGTNRGDAQAFKLDTLLKLVYIKGTDGKTTLLHFVVHEIIKSEGSRVSLADQQDGPTAESSWKPSLQDDIESRKRGLEVVASLGGELANVKKAAAMDHKTLGTDAANLAEGLVRVEEVAKMSEEVAGLGGNMSKTFGESMNALLKNAGEEIMRIQAKESCVLSKVKELTEYFHGNSDEEEAHPLRIFVVVRDFLSILDRVCKEVGKSIERNVISPSHSLPMPMPVVPL